MKHADCTPCQEWEICPFHPAEPPATAPAAPKASAVRGPVYDGGCDWATNPNCGCLVCSIAREGGAAPKRAAAPAVVVPPDWRYLGLDDHEVTNPPEHIYAIPETGGVVGIPQELVS